VDSIRSFDVGTQLSRNSKKIHIPNVENKIFQENREFFRLYLGENSDFYPKWKLFIAIRQAVCKAEEAENCPDT
jgi:hypothetical protein